ncbi:MAG: tetratricopeptide repeat protein, partial [Bacteroidales bacterium]
MAKLKEVEAQLKGSDSLKRAYEDAISTADELRKAGKYYQAQTLYKRAAMLNSKDVYAASAVHRMDSILSYQYSEKKDEFDNLRNKGDAAAKAGKYEEALGYYEKAKDIIPDDVYVTRQIAAINKTIENEKKKKEQEEKQLVAKYNQLLTEAAALRAKKNYQEALSKYQQALALGYNTAEVNRLIAETSQALRQLKIEQDYADTIRMADEAFLNKQYALAASLYRAAAGIKPNETYPLQQLDKIKNAEKQSSRRESQMSNRGQNLASEIIAGNNLTNLLKAYNTAKASDKPFLSHKIAKVFIEKGKTDSARIFLLQSLEAFRRNNQLPEQIGVLEDLANVYFLDGDYASGILTLDEAIGLASSMRDTLKTIRLLGMQSQNFINTFQYERALSYLDRTLELANQLHDTILIAELTTDKGDIYHVQNQYQQAADYYRKALKYAEILGDRKTQSLLRNNLGVLFFKMGNLDAALAEFNRAIRIGRGGQNTKEVSLSYNNIGNIHFAQHQFDKALEYYDKSLKIKEKINFQVGIGVTLYNIGTAYLELKKLAEADTFLQKSIDISKKFQFIELLQQSYLTLARVYELNNDFRGAVKTYKEYANIAVAPVSIESPVLETSFLYGKDRNVGSFLRKELYRQKVLADNRALINKQKEQELMIKDMELQQQRSKVVRFRSLFLFSMLSIILLSILSLQVYKRYREKRLLSEMIGFQKQQLTDSITYASRIQQAIMTPEQVVAAYFSDYFILNLPKDIVTGDYFFVAEVEGKVYVAVADCTGHGVPGAFMSILGISLTKEIILMQQHALHANEVLNQLRASLINALHQEGREDEAKDGIDIALCVIDRNMGVLEYSGANNPAYLIRQGELIELKADRMPIGIHPIIKGFEAQVVPIFDQDLIYLFSDGYRDQIGEETLKKFRKDEFARLLLDIHTLPLAEQKEKLYQRHFQWRGSMEQTDDILIMGLKV